MRVTGNYYLDIKFGDTRINISPQMVEEVSMTFDIDRLLPTFKISIKDSTGFLGEIIPYDKESNKVTIEFSRGENLTNLNIVECIVKRRKPDSNKMYVIEGTLDIQNALTKLYRRSYTGSIKATLEAIANDDLGIDNTEIGQSLDYDKTIIQTRWNMAKLFDYLINNLEGKNGESCYYCFIKNVRGKPTFVFKSLDELLAAKPSFNFIVGPKPYKNFYPIVEYKIYDNSQLILDSGAKTQDFGYFNYDTGKFIDDSVSVDGCPSVAERLLIDKDNANNSFYMKKLGRSNSFTSNFYGKVKSNFYDRINGLINMWVSTWGLENISSGDVVNVVFGEAMVPGRLFLYQHSGLWLIKRVVHVFGNSYMTNILLTRAGVDTDVQNSLMPSATVKRK